eukprot:s2334_g8.t1
MYDNVEDEDEDEDEDDDDDEDEDDTVADDDFEDDDVEEDEDEGYNAEDEVEDGDGVLGAESLAPATQKRHPDIKSAPSMWCFSHFDFQMCFAPQRRALFRHPLFQKCSENVSF